MSEIQNYHEDRISEERLQPWLSNIEELVTIVNDSQLESFVDEAQARIGHRDPKDWQEVALALKLGCAILTEDCGFLGAGIPTWTPDTIEHGLRCGRDIC